MSKTASHLAWIDLETDNLPTDRPNVIDFTDVHLMELALIVTDTDLNINEVGGYSEVAKMTKETADVLRSNPEVRKMHTENGLIKSCIAATHTIEDIDAEVDAMLSEIGVEKGMVAIAGSGVAMFDFPFIRCKMPLTASWLAYYPYDYGIFRRLVKSIAGRYVTNPQLGSYSDAKVHRAMNDVEEHLREAQFFRDWIRSLPQEA